jgi:pimeloyl-ACP methyl ester carboxylesterase
MWTDVQAQVAAFAPVCRYDRAGVGASDPPLHSARTGQDLTLELHTLLTTAGVPGPYVLVGHSFGGYPVRLYAHAYPQEVVSIVLVDSAHEAMIMEIPLEPEALDAAAIGQEVQASGTFNDMPLIVVTRGQDRSERWEGFQRQLLALSNNSKQIIAKDSNHQIPVNQPAVVVDAIQQVLASMRNHQALQP